MGGMFTKVALGWLGRRIPDWGGWLGGFLLAVFQFWNSLGPEGQEFVMIVLQGNWKSITLGALTGLVPLVISQIASFRTTVKPQVVTPEGTRRALDDMAPDDKIETVVAARRAVRKKKPSLLDRLTGDSNSGLTGG